MTCGFQPGRNTAGSSAFMQTTIQAQHLVSPQEVFEERRQRFAAVLSYGWDFDELIGSLPGVRGIVLHGIAVRALGMAVRE
jgi:hypothetical protein